MKIAVLGASGRAGSQITQEAVARGHDVIAFARHPEKIPEHENVTAIAGDATDPGTITPHLKGCDAVISALHFDVDAPAILGMLHEAGVPRLLVTGGAASLRDASGTRLIDGPNFPADWKPAAMGGITFLDNLKDSDGAIDWTFFSPAMIIFEGERLGHYRTGTDSLVTDGNGESKISFADYAIAMIDELENPQHSHARFTAAY